MTKRNRIISIIEWSLAVLLLATCIYYFVLSGHVSYSPLKAHKLSERISHFGPSEIVKTVDIDGGKLYLCKYKQWFAADVVKKKYLVWYSPYKLIGYDLEPAKKVSTVLGDTLFLEHRHTIYVYGQVNDPNIVSLSLEIGDEEKTLKCDVDESKMFIFYWYEDSLKYKPNYIRGYDKEGKVIFEEKHGF